MLNKEKFKDSIDFIRKTGNELALCNGRPAICDKIGCGDCDFDKEDDCEKAEEKWLNSEYVTTETDWTKVPIDTPIFVKNQEDDPWQRRHFAGYDCGIVYAYSNGQTSWTIDKIGSLQNREAWKYAECAVGVSLKDL